MSARSRRASSRSLDLLFFLLKAIHTLIPPSSHSHSPTLGETYFGFFFDFTGWFPVVGWYLREGWYLTSNTVILHAHDPKLVSILPPRAPAVSGPCPCSVSNASFHRLPTAKQTPTSTHVPHSTNHISPTTDHQPPSATHTSCYLLLPTHSTYHLPHTTSRLPRMVPPSTYHHPPSTTIYQARITYPHTTYHIPPTTFRLPHSNLRHSTYRIPPTTFHLSHSTYPCLLYTSDAADE